MLTSARAVGYVNCFVSTSLSGSPTMVDLSHTSTTTLKDDMSAFSTLMLLVIDHSSSIIGVRLRAIIGQRLHRVFGRKLHVEPARVAQVDDGLGGRIHVVVVGAHTRAERGQLLGIG